MANLDLLVDRFKKELRPKIYQDHDAKHPLYQLDIEHFRIRLEEIDSTIFVSTVIDFLPSKRKPRLIEYLMSANYLGGGTGGARIGIDASENYLTLSYIFDYETNYHHFLEKIEEFINYLDYWYTEIHNWDSRQDSEK